MLGALLVLATVVLLTLKIAGVIAVSWWLVFTPLLVLVALWLLAILLMAFAGAAMLTMILAALGKR